MNLGLWSCSHGQLLQFLMPYFIKVSVILPFRACKLSLRALKQSFNTYFCEHWWHPNTFACGCRGHRIAEGFSHSLLEAACERGVSWLSGFVLQWMKRSEGEHATATINYAYSPTWDICSCKTPKEFSLGSLQLGEIFFFWILISCHVMPHLSIDCLSCSLLDCWAEQRRQIVKTCLLGTKSHYHWDGNSDHWPIALAFSDVNLILVSVRHWFFSEVMQDLKVTLSGCLKKSAA